MGVDAHRTVLVVDDEPIVLRFMVHALASEFETLQAATAADGLQLFRTHGDVIDLVIIDMMMPGMSGLDLAAELARLRPELEILYVSGHSESLAMQCITGRRPEVVLFKPFDGDILLERVHRLLSAKPTP
jgi:CheY-like chemotaxis protein